MTADKDTYFVAFTPGLRPHHGFAPAGTQIDTGQPEFECFESEAEYLARLAELGVKPETDE